MARGLGCEREPGIELFSQPATRQVSSPLLRFTFEFGMESKWDRSANDTRKEVEDVTPSRLHQLETDNCQEVEKFRSSPRSVRMPRLHTLLHFHLAPINGCSSRDLTGLTP
jgi:hypothetical protein